MAILACTGGASVAVVGTTTDAVWLPDHFFSRSFASVGALAG